MYDRDTASNNDVMSGRYHTNPGQDQTHFDCHHMMFFLTNKHRYLGTRDVGHRQFADSSVLSLSVEL